MVSGRYGLEVEQWSDNRTLPISAVRIPLGTQIYMVANAPARHSRYIPITLRSGRQRYPYEIVRYNILLCYLNQHCLLIKIGENYFNPVYTSVKTTPILQR